MARGRKAHLVRLSAAHQLFARMVAGGAGKFEAYKAVGFSATPSARTDAIKLSADPKVKALIQQIQAEHAIRLNITADSLLLELEAARQRAILLEKPADEVNAVMGKAKILGLIKDVRHELNISLIPKPAFSPGAKVELTVDEWQRQWSPKEIELTPAPGAVNGGSNGHG